MRKFTKFMLPLTVFLSTCTIVPARIEPPVAPPPSTRDEVRAFAELVNKHRRSIGCKELTWVSAIAKVAQQHSEDMSRYDFFDHVNHEGKSPFDRLRAAGIVYSSAAENIAAGQGTAEQVLASWLRSSGHRRNIEDCRFLQHAIGLANNYWTHMFVRLR